MTGLFVNCDWGTSTFRLRLVETAPWRILAELRTASGVATLATETTAGDNIIAFENPATTRADRFQQVLHAGLEQLSQTSGVELSGVPVVISGMASSSLGWRELPYAGLPCGLDGQGIGSIELPIRAGSGWTNRVWLISGLRDKSDVLRGEETEILGLFQLPEFAAHRQAALVIKPGTHSKHLQIASRRIVGFQTFMTGELFDLLSRQSVLQHSIAPARELATEPNAAALALQRAVEDSAELPLSAALFRVRTRQLLDDCDPVSNRIYLSGLLVASELRYLADPRWCQLPLVLCAAGAQHDVYRRVAEALGIEANLSIVEPQEVDQLSVRGQALLLNRLMAEPAVG